MVVFSCGGAVLIPPHLIMGFRLGYNWEWRNWLIIWIDHLLFNFHTLDITVTAKSHWLP